MDFLQTFAALESRACAILVVENHKRYSDESN